MFILPAVLNVTESIVGRAVFVMPLTFRLLWNCYSPVRSQQYSRETVLRMCFKKKYLAVVFVIGLTSGTSCLSVSWQSLQQ